MPRQQLELFGKVREIGTAVAMIMRGYQSVLESESKTILNFNASVSLLEFSSPLKTWVISEHTHSDHVGSARQQCRSIWKVIRGVPAACSVAQHEREVVMTVGVLRFSAYSA